MVRANDLWAMAERERAETSGGGGGGDRIARAFAAFHGDHPEVYREFCRMVGELRAAGHRHYSAKAIIEVIRFHTDVNAGYEGRGEFKINNNFTALYARKWRAEHPGQSDFFETRKRKAGV